MKASTEAQPFSTDELELGMYVSTLDRPWLETPFLFQGFLIESSDVIQDLQEHCQFVYVDIERSDNSIGMLNSGRLAGNSGHNSSLCSSWLSGS